MKPVLIPGISAAFCSLLLSIIIQAQPLADSSKQLPGLPFQGKNLFESEEVFELTLSGNMRELLNDRGKISRFHPMVFSYRKSDSSQVSINTDVRTRGHFRKLKENCIYPPLLIHFSQSELLKTSIFKAQENLKLVMPCQGSQYVIHEWLVYKLYNLVTPKSFRAQLVKVQLEDTRTKKTGSPLFGILLEEHQQLAKRNKAAAMNRKMRPEQTEPDAFLTMAVFEYLIGNTDWSVQYLQNIKLLAFDSTDAPTAVPYDFDLAGIVDAWYAKPAEELQMNSVRERRFRGYCIGDMKKFEPIIALYNRLKKDIYSVYTDCTLLEPKYVKATIKYLDEFYATINNFATVFKEFSYPCDKNGTGNVVIKGLRDD